MSVLNGSLERTSRYWNLQPRQQPNKIAVPVHRTPRDTNAMLPSDWMRKVNKSLIHPVKVQYLKKRKGSPSLATYYCSMLLNSYPPNRTTKKTVLSQENRAMPQWISIDTECAIQLHFSDTFRGSWAVLRKRINWPQERISIYYENAWKSA